MRILLMAALSAVALGAAAPVAAQGYGDAPIPAPGGAIYAPAPPVYNGPPPRVSSNPPRVDRRQGPGSPNAGPRVWQNGRWMALPPSQNIARHNDPNRWGYDQRGRWEGGSRAPGGWDAYRRLGRGHRMPSYWLSGSFGISDFLNYGLAAPPQGYRWMRYYDDAVLVDYQGDVWDSVDGIAWAGASASSGGSYSNSESYSYSNAGNNYAQPIQQIDPNAYYGQPQYPQAGGQYGYGAGYGSSYQQGSYYYGAPTSTTVVIVPTTTTTTVVEEVIEEVVTTSYVRSAPRRVVRRVTPPKRHRAKPKPACCRCVCR